MPIPKRLTEESTTAEKARYVKAQSQDRPHHCHWPGCGRNVPPAMWGCKRHWFLLPLRLRNAIWRAYRPGQEKDMRPSREYLEIAHEVQEWIALHYPETCPDEMGGEGSDGE